MMQKLKEEITAAANRELNRANEQFPLFTSKHEGVAVAYKELEESKEALEELEASFKCLWDDVRGKETPCYLKEEITPLKIADYAINLACEAAKAELITNAVNAEVPGYYIQAMITGKKPDFLNTLDAEEEETGFRTEYEQITGAVVSIFEAWEKENGVESAAAGLHRLIDDLSKNRIEELRVIRENREAENAILSKLLIPPLRGDESRAEETESEGTQHDADGGSTEDKRTE